MSLSENEIDSDDDDDDEDPADESDDDDDDDDQNDDGVKAHGIAGKRKHHLHHRATHHHHGQHSNFRRRSHLRPARKLSVRTMIESRPGPSDSSNAAAASASGIDSVRCAPATDRIDTVTMVTIDSIVHQQRTEPSGGGGGDNKSVRSEL